MSAEKVRLRIGNLAKAVLVSGQAYRDPKEVLNEFVSNAADGYVQAERRGERIRLILRRKGRYPIIAIDDVGRRMTPERLRTVAKSLFESSKGDYLMVKDSEAMPLDYLATLVAKEYVVYNNPRSSHDELGEELVRVLVRVRKHIPKRP